MEFELFCKQSWTQTGTVAFGTSIKNFDELFYNFVLELRFVMCIIMNKMYVQLFKQEWFFCSQKPFFCCVYYKPPSATWCFFFGRTLYSGASIAILIIATNQYQCVVSGCYWKCIIEIFKMLKLAFIGQYCGFCLF